jgi:hypothetical protein
MASNVRDWAADTVQKAKQGGAKVAASSGHKGSAAPGGPGKGDGQDGGDGGDGEKFSDDHESWLAMIAGETPKLADWLRKLGKAIAGGADQKLKQLWGEAPTDEEETEDDEGDGAGDGDDSGE